MPTTIRIFAGIIVGVLANEATHRGEWLYALLAAGMGLVGLLIAAAWEKV